MSSPRLSATSYVVLGLVELCQPATPYDLKQFARLSVFNFWSVPHTQIYTECARLAEVGYLDEEREQSGRRRRVYRLAAPGRKALADWRAEATSELVELRDPGLLKLFFGADPGAMSEAQLEVHTSQLKLYEQMAQDEMPAGMRLALEAGIGHEREFIRFWKDVQKRAA